MPKITDQQIALARQYFTDGYSLPEAAKMSKMSLASIKKYLKSDIQTYIQEHEANAARKAIQPEPIAFESVTQSNNDLSFDQFVSYAEFEFANTPDDVEYIKNLYSELKADATNYDKVIKLRELYETRLNQIGKIKIEPEAIAQSIADNKTDYEVPESQTNKDIIRQYKNTLNIKIPIARRANEWEQSRLLEHIAYHILASKVGHKKATEWLESEPTDADKQAIINGVNKP